MGVCGYEEVEVVGGKGVKSEERSKVEVIRVVMG